MKRISGRILLSLAALAICRPAWASHWFMTGAVDSGSGRQMGGVDRDSIVRQTEEGVRRATFAYFSRSRRGTAKATGELDVDCPKLRFQQVRIVLEREDGQKATILSRGPGWNEPRNPTDRALLRAACTEDFSALTDIRDASPDGYAAARLAETGRKSRR